MKRLGLLLAAILAALMVGCAGSGSTNATGELGTMSHTSRIKEGEGPGWKLTMPVVNRNRKPKAATWPGAVGAMFESAPNAIAAASASGNVLAALGLAESLGTWVVPDLSSTQNVMFEFDGLATKVTVRGVHQEETADGRVVTTVEAVEVEAEKEVKALGK